MEEEKKYGDEDCEMNGVDAEAKKEEEIRRKVERLK